MSISRLQGTDGIRGLICPAESSFSSNPISAFLDEGVLTEDFFELYIFAYCMELLDANFASQFDCVVIGWDPRNISRKYYNSAIRGIRKAGLKAVLVDILPTPAISLYQLHIGAACGIVLTASHNPADQSGIKIFLGYSNLKLFPEDDKRLTNRCLNFEFEKLKVFPIIGDICNEHEQAKKLFIQFMADYDNHWVMKDTLDGITVITDCANGSFSHLIHDLVKYETGDFIFTNVDFNSGINFKSGVADLEGLEKILPDQIEKGFFSSYKSLNILLKKGREKRESLKSSSEMVLGIVFDGDGDRCFLLIYDPFKDYIFVLGGDVLAFYQSKFLCEKFYTTSKYFFVNTIESDVEAGRAAEKIGYISKQTAVGDKWILWHAFYNQLQSKLSFYQNRIDDPIFIHLQKKTRETIEKMVKISNLDALEATKSLIVLENWIRENIGNAILQEASNFLCERANNNFALGYEESGHLINLATKSSGYKKEPVFIGNSLKCAINSIVAINELRTSKNTPEFFDRLKNPFPSGYKKSLHVYYVNKSSFAEGSSLRKEIIKLLKECSNWSKIDVRFEKSFEEPEMLVLNAYDSEYCVASVFLRCSGTEDKIGIYFRGIKEFSLRLEELSKRIYPFLLTSLKNKQNQMAKAERWILNLLKNKPHHESELFSTRFKKIPLERLLNEMSLRQNLISKHREKWQITRLGEILLNFSECSEKY